MTKHWDDELETERDEQGNVWVTVKDETPWGTDYRHVNFGKEPEGDDE